MKCKLSGKRINISLGLKEAEQLMDALNYFSERGSCGCPKLCFNTAKAIFEALGQPIPKESADAK